MIPWKNQDNMLSIDISHIGGDYVEIEKKG